MTGRRVVDFYMSIESIWTHVGHAALLAACARAGATLRYRPAPLQALFAETGGVSYRQRHLARRRYRDYELQRWCARRGVVLDLSSSFLPPRAELADRFILACARAGLDPSGFCQLALDAAWREKQDVAEPALIEKLARQAGLPAGELLDTARSATIAVAYRNNLARGIEANVFGMPSFVLDGEVFWGQDRIEMLEEALAGGRTAYRPFA